jgi:hypothetical protein
VLARYAILSFCVFSIYSPAKETPWLSTLFETQSKDMTTCTAPLTEMTGIQARVKEGEDPLHTYFSNKADALAALKILAKYPGRSKATSAIMDHVENDKSVPLSERVKAILKVKPCNEIGYFKAFRHLISSVGHYQFSEEEKQASKKTVMNFVGDNNDRSLTLIALGVRMSLVQQMIDVGMLSMDASHLAKFKGLQDQLKVNMKQFSEQSKDWPEKLNADNAGQFPEATLRSFLTEIVFEMKKVGEMQKIFGQTLQNGDT